MLDHNLPKHFHRRPDAPALSAPPWIATAAHSQTTASLETLLIAGNSFKMWPESEIERWKASTDFSKLRLLGLSFRTGVNLAVLQALSIDCRLSGLRTLVLSLGYEDPSYHHTAERFISGLPNLTALHLLYFGLQTPTLLRLGPKLRTLSLRGRAIQAQDVSQLGEDCPCESLRTFLLSHVFSSHVRQYKSDYSPIFNHSSTP
jgi:hypothetical protein